MVLLKAYFCVFFFLDLSLSLFFLFPLCVFYKVVIDKLPMFSKCISCTNNAFELCIYIFIVSDKLLNLREQDCN